MTFCGWVCSRLGWSSFRAGLCDGRLGLWVGTKGFNRWSWIRWSSVSSTIVGCTWKETSYATSVEPMKRLLYIHLNLHLFMPALGLVVDSSISDKPAKTGPAAAHTEMKHLYLQQHDTETSGENDKRSQSPANHRHRLLCPVFVPFGESAFEISPTFKIQFEFLQWVIMEVRNRDMGQQRCALHLFVWPFYKLKRYSECVCRLKTWRILKKLVSVYLTSYLYS